MRRRLAELAAVVLLGIGFGTGMARADQGVRIGPGRIDVQDTLLTGGTYHLPDLDVSNPGSETASYRMTVGAVAGQAGAPVDPSWVSFSPATFTLGPGSAQAVATSVVIPAEARSGPYQTLLRAELVPSGGGLSLGAAAASRLTFSVAQATTLDSLVSGVRDALSAAGPWPGVLALVILVALLARFARRRWSFRVERRE
jgi:hypothetical protein